MHLTEQEKEMLNGAKGNAVKKSMEILVALGEIYGAKKLIDVTSVQIAGVSYDNLGDAGLEFLSEMAKDGKTKVLTTLNPAGMDMENYATLGISEEFAIKQKLVIEAFTKMGVIPTCAPYLIGNNPHYGEILRGVRVQWLMQIQFWEQNKPRRRAKCTRKRTNRKTPEYGMH